MTENIGLLLEKELLEEIATLTTENTRLREALELYANPSNYGTFRDRGRNAMGREYENEYITTDLGADEGKEG
jgi:hypothetical protein